MYWSEWLPELRSVSLNPSLLTEDTFVHRWAAENPLILSKYHRWYYIGNLLVLCDEYTHLFDLGTLRRSRKNCLGSRVRELGYLQIYLPRYYKIVCTSAYIWSSINEICDASVKFWEPSTQDSLNHSVSFMDTYMNVFQLWTFCHFRCVINGRFFGLTLINTVILWAIVFGFLCCYLRDKHPCPIHSKQLPAASS